MREETLVRNAVERELRDAQDNLYRARAAFKFFTPKQLAEQHGASGRSRQQILDEYEEWEYDCKCALAWLDKLIKGESK